MWILLAVALGAPPGFVEKGEAHGCRLFLGPTEADGVIPMWAECDWPDRSVADLGRVMADPSLQTGFRNVARSEVQASGDGWSRVWQHHLVPIVADREVLVDLARERAGEGYEWHWALVDDGTLPRMAGNVRCPRWEGSWLVQPDGDGVRVRLDNHYDPGEFPSWLVRPFLTGKLAESLWDMRQMTAP